MAQAHQIRREQGDGSRSRLEDQKTGDLWESKDQRADTWTTFWPQDIAPLHVSERRKRTLRRMLRKQEGEDPGEAYSQSRDTRKQQNRGEWKRRMVTTYAARFGLTGHQKQRSLHLVNDVLDLSSFASFSTEQVILGVINVVVREDLRFIEDERDFLEAAENEGLTAEDLRTLRSMVKQRL